MKLGGILSFVMSGAARILNNGSVFLITIILIRFGRVSELEIGVVLYCAAVLTVINLLTSFGMIEAIQFFVATKNPAQIITKSVNLQLIISIVSSFTVLVIGILGFFGPFFTPDLVYALSFAVLFSGYDSFVLAYNGLGKQLKSGIFQIIYIFLLLFVISILNFNFKFSPSFSVLFGYGIVWFLMNFIILTSFISSKLYIFPLKPTFRENLPDKDFLKFCFNNFIFVLALMVITQIDIIFIANILGSSVAGIYKPTAQIGLFIRSLGLAVTVPMFPILTGLIRIGDYKKSIFLVKILSGLIISGSILFSVFCYFYGFIFLNLIFNQSRIATTGSGILWQLVIFFGLNTAAMPIILLWQVSNNTKVLRNIILTQSILLVLLLCFFTKFGIQFVIFSLIFTEIIFLPIHIFMIKKTFK